MAAPSGFAQPSSVPSAFNNSGAITASYDHENISHNELARLRAGDVISHVWRDKSRNDGAIDAFAAVEILASPELIWSVMTSCEKTIEVVSEMKSCEVLETSGDGRWDIREQSFRTPFPLDDLRTIFRTEFTPFHQIKIIGMGGDMKVQEGLWQLTPLEDGRVRVAYHARLQPKFPTPGFLLRRAVRTDTPKLMKALKRVTEDLKNKTKTDPFEGNSLQ